jgi:hypothetical protein
MIKTIPNSLRERDGIESLDGQKQNRLWHTYSRLQISLRDTTNRLGWPTSATTELGFIAGAQGTSAKTPQPHRSATLSD